MFDSIIEIISSSVCHQLSSRCLTIGNITLPICARCSGIYTGFFITAVILFIMYRKKESGIPPLYILIILSLFFLSTIVDGIASNFGLYNTNNNIRFITGFLCGSSIMIITYPIFIYQYYRQSEKEKIFKRPGEFLTYILIIAAFILVTLLRLNFMDYFYYYFAIFSVLFTFYFTNMVLVFLIPFFSQKAYRFASKYLILPSIIAIALSSIELFVSYWFHKLIIRFLNS